MNVIRDNMAGQHYQTVFQRTSMSYKTIPLIITIHCMFTLGRICIWGLQALLTVNRQFFFGKNAVEHFQFPLGKFLMQVLGRKYISFCLTCCCPREHGLGGK